MTEMNYKSLLTTILILSIFSFAAITYVNCFESETIEYEPQQIEIGPYDVEKHLSESGCTDPDTFIVTAYLAIDEFENRFHGITYTGVPAKANHTIAVDPNVIPLGSMIYVEGLGWWRAEDTGNMIIGKRLDICVESRDEAMEWGKRKRQVWYLTPEQIAAQDREVNTEIASAGDIG